MSGCSFVAPGLVAQVSSQAPIFQYVQPHLYDYFGVQMAYVQSGSTCYGQSFMSKLTPIIKNPAAGYTKTCTFLTATSSYTGLYCTSAPVTEIPNGKLTISVNGYTGVANSAPLPFTASFGQSPPAATATQTSTETAYATQTNTASGGYATTSTANGGYDSTVTVPGGPASTQTVYAPSGTVTRLSIVYGIPVTTTSTQTNTVSSCSNSAVSSSSSRDPSSSSVVPPSSSSSAPSSSSSSAAPPSSSSAAPTLYSSAAPPSSSSSVFPSSSSVVVPPLNSWTSSPSSSDQPTPNSSAQPSSYAQPTPSLSDHPGSSAQPTPSTSDQSTQSSSTSITSSSVTPQPSSSSVKQDASTPVPSPSISSAGTPTSSSAAVSPTSTSPSCNGDDGKTYSTSAGDFIIECGIDRYDHDLGPVGGTHDFGSCIQACAARSDCVVVSWNGNCYLKDGVGQPNKNSNVWGARLVSVPTTTVKTSEAPATSSTATSSTAAPTTSAPATTTSGGIQTVTVTTTISNTGYNCQCTPASMPPASMPPASTPPASTPVANPQCPDNANATFTSSCGAQYMVECYIDRYGEDLPNGNSIQSSLAACVNDCDNTPGCVDVSWVVGSQCYKKGSIAAVRKNDNIWGARQISGCTSSSPVATATLGKLKLHRKRVVRNEADVQGPAPILKRQILLFGMAYGPDKTYITTTNTVTSTSTVSQIVTVTTTAMPSGTATTTAGPSGTATITAPGNGVATATSFTATTTTQTTTIYATVTSAVTTAVTACLNLNLQTYLTYA